MNVSKNILKSIYFISSLLKFTMRSFAGCFFIVYLAIFKYRIIKKIINISEIALIFSLGRTEVNNFRLISSDKRFFKEFSIPLIRDASLIIIDSHKNFSMEISKRIVIGSSSLNYIFIPFLLLILKIKFRHIIKNTFAGRVNLLAAKRKLSVFVTNSSLGKDPFGFCKLDNKNFTTHCAHYSENALGIDIGKVQHEPFGHPSSKWLAEEPSDYQWVWSEEYADYIKKINPKTKVNAIGFVSFSHLPIKPTFTITVFDVTPVDPRVMNAHPLYQVDESKKFVSNILKVTDTINSKNDAIKVVVHLKPKRAHQKIHSYQYILFLEDLKHQNRLMLEHHSTNPYELVSKSDLVISAPFTTAAQVGKKMGVPSVYYNYLNEDIYYPINTSVILLQNYQELFNYVEQLVYEKTYSSNVK
jgi:polysaccharide biosynthesis PFTS motif protein